MLKYLHGLVSIENRAKIVSKFPTYVNIAAKSFLLSEVPKGRSDQIAFSARIDQSDAVISLLPRFAARFRPFWVPPIKKTLHARVNRIF